MAITPAFSPGPWSTYGAVVGSVFSSGRECLYEQCSLQSALTMPSSVKVGVRPSIATSRSYSPVVRPCSATSTGVMTGSPGRALTVTELAHWAMRVLAGVLAGVLLGAGFTIGGFTGMDGRMSLASAGGFIAPAGLVVVVEASL